MAELLHRLSRGAIGASVIAAVMTLQAMASPAAATDRVSIVDRGAKARTARQDQNNETPKKTDKVKDGDHAKDQKGSKTLKTSKRERREMVKRAQVWMPTNIPSMDLRLGPQDRGAFEPWQEVTCDYVYDEDLPGTSRKFNCAISKDDVVKVRYGEQNGKVEGEVAASRLLWALGFGADRVYPVKVRCRGCSPDPWTDRKPFAGEQVFELAAIERKFPGDEIKADKDGGWSWKELRHVDESLEGASQAQIDAMKLLAVLIQHTDNKIINERFVCLPGGKDADGGCSKPFLYMHDVGLTFGHANLFDNNDEGSVSFEDWAATPMWRGDAKMCVGHMRRSATGMLGDPQISEAGRKFLADLLVQLSDQQIRDLFEVARVDHRSRKPGTEAPPASLDEWVGAFKSKRDEIINNKCDK